MPLMQYKAMDERGRVTGGRMEAANVADLELRLGRMGLDLINYKETTLRTGAPGSRVRRRDLIDFCFDLEQLVSSGVPLLEGLSDIRDSVENPRLREVTAGMIESIEGGKTLSSAMEEYPRVFDSVFVNLVRAGEFSGRVDEVLRDITESLKWQDELSELARRLLMYPAIVATVVLMVVVFLMTYLVPQLVAFIETMQRELPLHTKVLLSVSDAFVAYWYIWLTLPFAAAFVLATLKRTNPSVRLFMDELLIRFWIIGPILKKIILARFARYFALMYSSGITVLDCVRISENLVGNKAVEQATRRAGRQIADGASLSAGFESTGLFPPLVLRMLRVGENTGGLDTALLNISYFYDRDVRESMQRLETVVGPALILVLGGLMFWVIVSVLGPIYDLITTINI
ncbi:MAG: type II secretion system F family protein [Gammaproteobacteria bacterium]|nr:type II secretion system F family protein [Gammaproteobacteria bacterium]NIR81894.1 type II secretion system F family protein [Gammaproteobacteria bacterium]NIR88726.1 type II secretion system F family protein [Gammaproteobacteria bacterium]NIU03002.1 type II secretion system F family protein [Gammaproteobacteria bacterium]NIV50523.1 type II secretion system F family protein [Gammaproteobacteria bacterium]